MAPAGTITGGSSTFGLAFDYNGNLYVADIGASDFNVFAPPYTGSPTAVSSPSMYGLASYATYLFGADAMSGAIDAYTLPVSAGASPAYVITATDPHAVALDGQGTLYVGDQHGGAGNGTIDVFTQPLGAASTSAYSIANGVVEPVELAVSQ